MDPIILLIAAMTFWIKNAAVDGVALAKGKEAPTLERFRTRHKGKQDKLKAPTKAGKQPGPVRQWARAVTENTSAELVEKSRHKSQRRIAWYRETAPQRDKAWREKQQRKLQKQIDATERFAQRRGVVVDQSASTGNTTTATSPDSPERTQQPEAGQSTQDQQTSGGNPTQTQTGGGQQPSTEESTNTSGNGQQANTEQTQNTPSTETTASSDNSQDKQPDEDMSAPGDKPADSTAETAGTDQPSTDTTTDNTTTTGANGMYEQAAADLIRSAEEIDQYRAELTVFADGMAGRGWGTEVTGPVADMDSSLAEAAGAYRDLANQMKSQGDAVRDAYDAAPYVPDKNVVMA